MRKRAMRGKKGFDGREIMRGSNAAGRAEVGLAEGIFYH